MSSFAKDSRTENWLANRGIPFHYKTSLRLSSLSTEWQRINHGRPNGKPIDDEVVERYASALQDGAVFPAPILAKASDGYQVLDGCQRLAGAEIMDITIFNGYVVDTDDQAKHQEIRICANAVLNGTPPSAEWTVSQIVSVLHEQFRYTASDCSAASGFKTSTIEKEIRARHGKQWMECHGIDTSKKPANQRGFQAAFNAILGPKLKAAPKAAVKIVSYCQKLKSNNSEAESLLKEFADIRKKKHCDQETQMLSKLHEVAERPEYKARIEMPRKRHPVDNATTTLAGAATALRNAQQYHSDPQQSKTLVELLHECKVFVRKIVPREEWATDVDVIA